MFANKNEAFETGRTRNAIVSSMRHEIKALHAKHFPKVASSRIIIEDEGDGNLVTFKINAHGTPEYEPWTFQVNLAPFIRNYNEWMYGTNDEWKKHFKPFVR
jgi:hypothetical protein